MKRRCSRAPALLVAALVSLAIAAAAHAQAAAGESAVRLYAAGSLRTAMQAIAQAFTARTAVAVAATFGPSGALRERLEKGEAADVFASADVANAQALAQAGRAKPPVVFARNTLCALVAPGVDAGTATILERMLDPRIRLGTSTPGRDPSGDYAWQLFARAEAVSPGARATLEAKALKLAGGTDSRQPPAGRTLYGLLIEEGKADIFLTYCTNVDEAVREVQGARRVDLPVALAVGAAYALTVLDGARPDAEGFARFVLAPEGQALLAKQGFAPPAER